MINETLGEQIRQAIKRKEYDAKIAEDNKRREKIKLISEIKYFFKYLPEVGSPYEFENMGIGLPGGDKVTIRIIKEKSVTTVLIDSQRLSIDDWDISFIRSMHSLLSRFEDALKKRYGL